ncbi:MAG: hypothetical protein ACRERV_05070 [Methylococcales bacterium]
MTGLKFRHGFSCFYQGCKSKRNLVAAFKMLDADIVAVSPSSVYRVLKAAGLVQRQESQTSRKGDGFQAPKRLHGSKLPVFRREKALTKSGHRNHDHQPISRLMIFTKNRRAKFRFPLNQYKYLF